MAQEWNVNIHYDARLAARVPARAAAVLDVGCGDGFLAARLARQVPKAVAIDINAPVLDRARARFPDAKVTWCHGDVLAYPLELASFDAVLSNAALHHLPDTRAALRGLGELVRPGGTLAVVGFPQLRRDGRVPWLAPRGRSVAEALVTVTIALTAKEKDAPEPRVLRRALFAWAFNPATRETDPPREIALALGWAARASLPVSALDDPATVRLALGACAKTLAGKPAAGSTQRRKRSVFCNALATPSNSAVWPPTPSTVSSGPPPPSPRPSTAGWWSAPPRPGTCWPPWPGSVTVERTWRRSTPACTTPRSARLRRSCSASPTCTCRRRAGAGSSWPPPPPGPARPGLTTAPPARSAASTTAPTTRQGRSRS
jgi:ubiquinone/menaquinone biosynthesis C-methylase UbiE